MPKQKTKHRTPEQQANYERLQSMMKEPENPFAGKLKELENILTVRIEPILVEEAAKSIGTSTQGIKDILATTHCSTIEIFSVEKGQKEIWYIKIKKKQPQNNKKAAVFILCHVILCH